MPKDDTALNLAKGSTVFVPARIWPSEKPPKGRKGWEGEIVAEHDKDNFVVKFKGDATKYFFKKADLEKWTRTEFGAACLETPGAGPSGASPSASPAKKAKPGFMSAPVSGITKETEPVIDKINRLLPYISLDDLKTLLAECRRMAAKS